MTTEIVIQISAETAAVAVDTVLRVDGLSVDYINNEHPLSRVYVRRFAKKELVVSRFAYEVTMERDGEDVTTVWGDRVEFLSECRLTHDDGAVVKKYDLDGDDFGNFVIDYCLDVDEGFILICEDKTL